LTIFNFNIFQNVYNCHFDQINASLLKKSTNFRATFKQIMHSTTC